MTQAFYIKTFGCQMNERDSEIISQSLAQHDYIETMDMDAADLVILNTCSIRAKAEQKVMSLLGQLRRNKKSNPNMQICVAGCVAQQEGQTLIERMPHVDLVIGTQHIYNIAHHLTSAKDAGKVVTELSGAYEIPKFIPSTGAVEAEGMIPESSAEFSRFVTIMQGCNNFCTYCVVPYTRGREVSRKYNDIIEEVKVLIESGVKEITLLGQNVNSYGQTNVVTDDGSPCSFGQLLTAVSRIDGVQRLRFTTSNPKDLSEGLMRCFQDLDNLCPQFHLPVQAGSNDVLKRMNRKYTIEKYYELVNTLRSYRPDIILTTDIIVGFPGETEEDFNKTMDLLEKVRFDGSFSFKYSDRPGTASMHLDDKVPEGEKSRRLSTFQNRQNEISLKNNYNHIGKVFKVMVEEKSSDSYRCRADTNHVVHCIADHELSPGDIVYAVINHAGKHSLKVVITGAEVVQ